ncbi:MAG: glycoside hydrolase family 16 protein, partial [Mobilitalea sp.]
YTKDLQTYGIYEARMKLPDAPSSITGVFLYMAPDYYYEIDIEVVNDSKGTLYFTTYDNGEMRKHFAGTLGFDPTKEYHKYRMEYQEDLLSFYIDNVLIKEWKQGYPKAEMQLYINCWYPKWLEGIKPDSDQKLLIDWVKY